MLKLRKHIIFLLAAAMIIVGCSKDDFIDNPDKNNTSISNFTFKTSNNSGLSSNTLCISNIDVIYATIPEGVDITSLIPSFTVGQGASVTINGIPVESDVTRCNFSNTSKIVVTSESGNQRTYTILVRNGNIKIDNMGG